MVTNNKINLNVCTFCRRKTEIQSWLKIWFNKEGLIKGYQLSLARYNERPDYTPSIRKPHAYICKECLTSFHKLFDADLYVKE